MANVVPFESRRLVIPGMPQQPMVYTVQQAAYLLGISRGSAYDLVRDGTIPAERLGRRWVVPRARFHAWLGDRDEDTFADQAEWAARTESA